MSRINNGKIKPIKNNDLFSFSSSKVKQAEKHEQGLKSKPIVSDVKIAEVSNNVASFFKEKQVFSFNVSATKKFQINTTKITENRNESTSLVGVLVGGYGFAVLVRTPKGISGTLRTKDQLYKVEPAAVGLAAISLIDETKFPQDHSSKIPLGSLTDSLSKTSFSKAQSSSDSFRIQSTHAPNGGPTHGLLVLYTQSVANNTSDISGLIQTANDETNLIYENSNVAQNVYIAHSEQTSYDESGRSYEDHTDALANTSDGMMDNIPSLRNQYNADLVVLLVDDSEACGRANAIGASKGGAVVAVNYSCATGYYSYAHELGHLFGARHDRAVDDTNIPYHYGHGYVDPNDNWRTVMAYSNACGGCSRVPYWSNPDVNYPPTGQAIGTSTHEDNARAVANRKNEFRDFYTLGSPSNVSFDNPYSDGEHPEISWSSNSDPDVDYHVYRCMNTSGQSGPSCYTEIFSLFTSATTFEDKAVRTDNSVFPAPCESYFVFYSVSAQNYTGLSDRSVASTGGGDGCVEYQYQ